MAFSEPVVTASAQMLLTTAGGSELLSASWDDEGQTATLQVPYDLAVGANATLEVAAATSDRAGNSLAGGWSRDLGLLTRAPAPEVCVPSAPSLTPDGDTLRTDASVRLDWLAAASPDTWDWIVWRGTTRVASGSIPGSARTLTWDGAGDDGRFASAGEHRLVLRGNARGLATSEACAVTLTVLQPLAAPSASR